MILAYKKSEKKGRKRSEKDKKNLWQETTLILHYFTLYTKKRKEKKKKGYIIIYSNFSVSLHHIYLVRPRPNLEVQCGDADCGVSLGHSRGRGGIQLRDAFTVERMSPGPLGE